MLECPRCENNEKIEVIGRNFNESDILYVLFCRNCGHFFKETVDHEIKR